MVYFLRFSCIICEVVMRVWLMLVNLVTRGDKDIVSIDAIEIVISLA